jgi:branched chain amino acid efflux pump
MTAWIVTGLLAAATVALKASGPVLLGGRRVPERLAGVLDLLAPVVLAALVAVQTFGGRGELVLDARAVGLGAALVAVVLRAPVIVVVVTAAAATALVRALSG